MVARVLVLLLLLLLLLLVIGRVPGVVIDSCCRFSRRHAVVGPRLCVFVCLRKMGNKHQFSSMEGREGGKSRTEGRTSWSVCPGAPAAAAAAAAARSKGGGRGGKGGDDGHDDKEENDTKSHER
jgi:hypothetical protein